MALLAVCSAALCRSFILARIHVAVVLVTLAGVALVNYLLPSLADAQAMSKSKTEPSLSKRARLAQDLFHGFSHHLTDAQMRLVYAIGGLTFMMMVNQFSFIQLHLMAAPYEWSRFQATLIFLCYSSGTIASYFTAKWLAKFGQHKVISVVLVRDVARQFTDPV